MDKSKLARRGLDSASKLAIRSDGTVNPRAESALLKLFSVQRPVVLAAVRQLRRMNPDATPHELQGILDSYYKNLATGGGAAVGATAVVPGIGTGAALALAGAETAGFLEMTALYAQGVAEIHGLAVREPERANALVMGLMLGQTGKDLVQQFSQQASGKGSDMTSTWGQALVSQLPSSMVGQLSKQLRKHLFKRFAAKTSGNVLGRILPFGIGAVVGGVTNRNMAGKVIEHARTAFGSAQATFTEDLRIDVADEKKDADLVAGFRRMLKRGRKGDKSEALPGEVIDSPADASAPGPQATGPATTNPGENIKY